MYLKFKHLHPLHCGRSLILHVAGKQYFEQYFASLTGCQMVLTIGRSTSNLFFFNNRYKRNLFLNSRNKMFIRNNNETRMLQILLQPFIVDSLLSSFITATNKATHLLNAINTTLNGGRRSKTRTVRTTALEF